MAAIVTPQKAQLLLGAHRILTDGRRHSRAARQWAERELAMPVESGEEAERRTHRFTPTEVLLARCAQGAMA